MKELINIFLEKNGELDHHAEWVGMPEYDQPDTSSFGKLLCISIAQMTQKNFSLALAYRTPEKQSHLVPPKSAMC